MIGDITDAERADALAIPYELDIYELVEGAMVPASRRFAAIYRLRSGGLPFTFTSADIDDLHERAADFHVRSLVDVQRRLGGLEATKARRAQAAEDRRRAKAKLEGGTDA